MCHDWSEEYTACCHVSRRLINCPKYYKQQSLAKTFLGRLFYRNVKNKKHCGRLIPHHAAKPFCSKCTVMVEELRARHVGDGALMAYQIGLVTLEDDFRRPFKEYRERRRDAARKSLERSEEHIQYGEANRNHRVWIPELYHNPQMLAKARPYGRQTTEEAPPVSSTRWNKPSAVKNLPRVGEKEKKSQKRERQRGCKRDSNRSHKHERSASAERIPAYDHSQPPKRPVEPAPTHYSQRRRDVVGSEPPLSPIPGLSSPPPSPITQRGTSNWTQERQYAPHQPPFATLRPAPARYPTLRRKPGRIFNISPPKPAPAPMNVPLPEYQVYLNALRSAPSNSTMSTGSITQCPGPRPPPKRKKGGLATQESHSSFLRRMMGLGPGTPDSGISDISFACQHSMWLTNQDM
ncbi:hypothetical protein F5Y05DRAFT_95558 [Hypoxylon sp. FL0543]|nr:hypothetical protein F5Y05DRAFT_95558 [Hypoxylon sp. FL0543]